jgi:hypothetical protein
VTHRGYRQREGSEKLFRQFECDVSEDSRPATLAIYFLRVNKLPTSSFSKLVWMCLSDYDLTGLPHAFLLLFTIVTFDSGN